MVQGAAFRILACFHDQDSRSFVELCQRAGYPTDLGGYYIRHLLKGGYIEKTDRGQYHVLPKGKQQLALQYGKQTATLRPRFVVAIVARQGNEFVVSRRRVQPFLGAAEWPAGIVLAGEEAQAAARRVLQARLGVVVVPLTMVGFLRRIDRYDNTVFDDKLFAVHTCDIPEGIALQTSSVVGENHHCAREDLHKLDKLSRSLLDILRYTEAGNGQFEEHIYKLSAADLAPPDIEHH